MDQLARWRSQFASGPTVPEGTVRSLYPGAIGREAVEHDKSAGAAAKSDTAAVPTARPPPEPVTKAEIRATAALFLCFVITILLAVWFADPFRKAGLDTVTPNHQDVGNSLWYFLMVMVFTAVILAIAKWGPKWVIRVIILGAVASTIFFVLFPLLAAYWPSPQSTWWQGMDLRAAGIAVAASAAAVVALYKHPEWYVVDSVGLLVAAASATLFGINFGIVPVVVLLAALAVYDAIAVYKTRHMLALADSVIELRLPILLVIPKHGGYKFQEQAAKFKEANAENKGEREAMFMGLGDLVMPTMLVVSCIAFLPGLIALPLASHLDAPDLGGPVPLELRLGSTPSHPATLNYTLDVESGRRVFDYPPPPVHWRVQAGSNVTEGTGLPAIVPGRTYDSPTAVFVNATVTGADGRNSTLQQWVEVEYANSSWDTPFQFILHSPPALGASIGLLLGFGVLMMFVLRGNPQAGLPLLNGGALAGFLIGLYVATGSIRFW
jgi:presenilin-like A22 family membrane protease